MRQKGRAVRDGVKIYTLQQMPCERPDVCRIQNQVERKLALDAQAVAVDRRDLPLETERFQIKRGEQHILGIDVFDKTVQQRGGESSWRIRQHGERLVTLEPVVEHPAAATHDDVLLAGNVIGETDSGSIVHAAVLHQILRHVLARLGDAVQYVPGIGHDPSRGGERNRLSRKRVDADLVACRIESRAVEPRRLLLVETFRQKCRGLQRRVELRLDPVETYAVIERQLSR